MLPSDAYFLSVFFSEYQNTRIDIRLKLLTTMKRPLILLLLVLIQLQSYGLVGAKEEEEKTGKDGEKKKEKEMGEKTKEVKDEEEEKEMKEDMEDTCLSSPCGAHARCKNVQVPKSSSSS